VIGDMLELGRFSEEHHRLIGEFAAAQGIDEILCYGPETRATCCAALSAGLKAHHFGDKSELGSVLAQIMTTGDVVYLKGSRGMAMETVIQEVFERYPESPLRDHAMLAKANIFMASGVYHIDQDPESQTEGTANGDDGRIAADSGNALEERLDQQ